MNMCPTISNYFQKLSKKKFVFWRKAYFSQKKKKIRHYQHFFLFFFILLFIFHVQINLNSNSPSALKALLRQVGNQFHVQFTNKIMSF